MGGEIEDLFCIGVKYMLIEEIESIVRKEFGNRVHEIDDSVAGKVTVFIGDVHVCMMDLHLIDDKYVKTMKTYVNELQKKFSGGSLCVRKSGNHINVTYYNKTPSTIFLDLLKELEIKKYKWKWSEGHVNCKMNFENFKLTIHNVDIVYFEDIQYIKDFIDDLYGHVEPGYRVSGKIYKTYSGMKTVRRVEKSGSPDGKTTMSICETEHKYNLFSSYFS